MIFGAIYCSYYFLVPHKISGDKTPMSEFSSTRAMEHIKKIAFTPHFVGTYGHDTVQKYILRVLKTYGLQSEVQSAFSVNDKWRGATQNQNIFAIIPGKNHEKALMLLSHYDSAPFVSPGASDAAVGVGTILESVRAFKASGIVPTNDIYILISDGEEIGLNGAKAFMENNPLANKIGVVLNFEARGSGGPSYTLLETNGGNKKMVEAYTKAHVPYPIANSFLYSIYKILPNDTDLTMFRELGDIEGFNFAFIDDFFDYHSSTDNVSNVDINTIEHQGTYLNSMLKYFIANGITDLKSNENMVYFNFPPHKVFTYPFSYNIILFIIMLIWVGALIFIGVRKNIFNWKSLLWLLLPLVGLFTSSTLTSFQGWKQVLRIHPQFKDILQGVPYNAYYYIIAVLLIVIISFIGFYFNAFKKKSTLEVAVPFILFWVLLIGVFNFVLPGASFLVIPVLLLLLSLTIDLLLNFPVWLKILIYTILSLPGVIIISPFITMFVIGLKMVALPVSALFCILLLGLLIPVFKYLPFKGVLLAMLSTVLIVVLVLAEKNSKFSEYQPIPTSLNYMFNIDENKAYWETYNNTLDPWLNKNTGGNLKPVQPGGLTVKSKFNSSITYRADAKIIDIKKPIIKILIDTVTANERTIEFQILPQRKVNALELMSEIPVKFKYFSVNGKSFGKDKLSFDPLKQSTIISYFITQEGEYPKFRFTIDKNQNAKFLLQEGSLDLLSNKELNISPRPKDLVPMPFVWNDMIITVSKLKF